MVRDLVRQWATFHPEFAYLPRKFKIAVTGAEHDRAATCVHDIGLRLVRDDAGEVGFRVIVGGGMGRTPIIGHVIREFLPVAEILTYLEAILRVYNRFGRRDNIYKARIKILVKERGPGSSRDEVEDEWAHLSDGDATLTRRGIRAARSAFQPHRTRPARTTADRDKTAVAGNRRSPTGSKRNVHRTRCRATRRHACR